MGLVGTRLGARLGTRLGADLAGAVDPLYTSFRGLFASDESWFDANSMSGSNLVDRIDPTHSIVLSSGTLAAPAADALFGGALSLAFTGTQRCISNRAASAWTYLHSGAGCDILQVFAIKGSAAGYLWATGGAVGLVTGSNTGAGVTLAQGSNSDIYFRVANGTANVINSSPVTASALDVGLFTEAQFLDGGGTPEYVTRKKSATTDSGDTAVVPSAGAPTATLSLGTDGAGAFPSVFNLRALYFFKRVLTPSERAIVYQWIQRDTGISA